MAKMGSRKHLKRYKAPKSWPIHPKEDTWTVKPSAGSHSINDSIPLTLVTSIYGFFFIFSAAALILVNSSLS